jgi:hypothetical protein
VSPTDRPAPTVEHYNLAWQVLTGLAAAALAIAGWWRLWLKRRQREREERHAVVRTLPLLLRAADAQLTVMVRLACVSGGQGCNPLGRGVRDNLRDVRTQLRVMDDELSEALGLEKRGRVEEPEESED